MGTEEEEKEASLYRTSTEYDICYLWRYFKQPTKSHITACYTRCFLTDLSINHIPNINVRKKLLYCSAGFLKAQAV